MSQAKMILNRERSTGSVGAAFDTHAEAVGAQLDALVKKYCPAGFEVGPMENLLRAFGHILRGVNGELNQAALAHDAEKKDDAAPREARDTARDEGVELAVDYREVLTGVYGSKHLPMFGFTGPTPSEPLAVQKFLEGVAVAMKTVTVPEARIETTFAPAGAARKFATVARRIETAIADVNREARELEVSQVAKDRAQTENDRVFTALGGAGVALLRLVGQSELADRLRPSARRPGQTMATEGERDGEGEGGGETGGAGSGGTGGGSEGTEKA